MYTAWRASALTARVPANRAAASSTTANARCSAFWGWRRVCKARVMRASREEVSGYSSFSAAGWAGRPVPAGRPAPEPQQDGVKTIAAIIFHRGAPSTAVCARGQCAGGQWIPAGKCGGNFAAGVPLCQQPQWVAVNGCKLLHGLHQVLGLLLINHRIFGNRGRVSIAVKVRFFLAGSIRPLSQQQKRPAACTADKVSRKLVRVLPVQAGKVFGYVQKYFLRYILSKVRVVDDLAGNVYTSRL